MQNKINAVTGMLLLAALTSCSLFSSQSEYDRVPPGKALEVPPDLDEPAADGAVRVPNSTYSRSADGPVGDSAPAIAATPVAAASTPQPGTRIESVNGSQTLIVDDSMESVWRRLGFALPRIGLKIEDQERERGVYTVEYVDTKAREQRPGALSRWILRKKGPTDHSGSYDLKLVEVDQQTRVSLLDKNGSSAAAAITAEILTSLLERLN